MYLTERHSIKRSKRNISLFERIDTLCYYSKNLYNATNYIITQANRISYKLRQGEILDSWEKHFIYKFNCGIKAYNDSRPTKKKLPYITESNSFIANAYFLSWYLKGTTEYKALYATCSQMCIQQLCKNWKAFYQELKTYKQGKITTFPHKPKYYDKETGRGWLLLTYQSISVSKDNRVTFPKFLGGLTLKTRHTNIKQVRIITRSNKIVVELVYDKEETTLQKDKSRILGIDLGVDNFATVVSNTDLQPIILNGRVIKSINQWYNKEKARLQAISKKQNNRYMTKRICKLTERRNNKVKNSLHKISRYIIEYAKAIDIGLIIVGNNKGWKQEVSLGKRINQTFVSIPYAMFIDMLTYKAKSEGIEVITTEESYTSGTSYLDNEAPTKENYNKSRRISRGLFLSNTGTSINADVNGAYQIMRKIIPEIPVKIGEKVTRVNVA